MNLQLTGHQLDITPAIRGYVTSKLERITRHFDHVIDVSVILSVSKLQQKVEANVHVPGGDIFCESSDEDMYAAIIHSRTLTIKARPGLASLAPHVEIQTDFVGSEI